MKVVGYVVAVVIYIAALLYLLLSLLGFHFGLRVGGNLYAEEGGLISGRAQAGYGWGVS